MIHGSGTRKAGVHRAPLVRAPLLRTQPPGGPPVRTPLLRVRFLCAPLLRVRFLCAPLLRVAFLRVALVRARLLPAAVIGVAATLTIAACSSDKGGSRGAVPGDSPSTPAARGVAGGFKPPNAPRENFMAAAHGSASALSGDSARGLALMEAFADSLPSYSGNSLRCTSCHLDRGLNPAAMPWVGSAAGYPRYRSRSGSVETITMRINDCIVRSLAGRVLPDSSRDMQDMIAYLVSIGAPPRPAGVDTVRAPGDPARGESSYAANCARCHGMSGEGTMLAPAVWGEESYSIGAGMARRKMLATFLRHNMPYDMAGSLGEQDAADIAAWVLSQPRQDYPGKERDWPNADPPADVAYSTTAARQAGKPLPPERPLLPRRVPPGN